MKRRKFLKQCMLATAAGCFTAEQSLLFANTVANSKPNLSSSKDLYQMFLNPGTAYRPFIRWWWNGNKVEKAELKRELQLLKDAGIGGVEINPISFPRYADPLNKKSLTWLSDEWIDILQYTFDEAKKIGITCDLLVGSGWPFGAEYLRGDERADVVTNYSEALTGPIDYEISEDGIFSTASPAISSPFIGRTMELMSLQLVPEPFNSLDQVIDVMKKDTDGNYRFKVPEGNWVLFALFKVKGFQKVINGAPGANGPVLNHLNKKAVQKYLDNMSDKIQQRIGPLKSDIRALFCDGLELEGSNWTYDMREEFQKRRGYDILPYLPYLFFRSGGMGNVLDYTPRVKMGKEMADCIDRVRFDFALTNAEMYNERFTQTYAEWCRKLGIQSRLEAYGRGTFPLEGSMEPDIPECESWTTNWLWHKIGEEMSEKDYRRGRAYTMINKYVSSGAHLAGKKIISCEEMTNTYLVFNMTLELLKIGGDQTAISGVTHSVFHGFNYSPNKELPFPGWIQYGAYYSERNNWWPFFHLYNAYKGRLSTALQHSTMYADIAILNPIADMWTTMGMQNEPFPSSTIHQWKTMVWEAMSKNGNGVDYISESIIQKSSINKGYLHYGPRKYNTLFLIVCERLDPSTLTKVLEFVQEGGRVFCIDAYPHLSTGWHNHEARDKEVQSLVEQLKKYSDRFILLHKPKEDFIGWYQQVQKDYQITPYLTIETPNLYLMQNRYITDEGNEMFFFAYAHRYLSHKTRISFSKEVRQNRTGWVWDLESGKRYRLELDKNGSFLFDFGPADSLLIVFDKQRRGDSWKPLPTEGKENKTYNNDWDVEFKHSLENTQKKTHFDKLIDLKEDKEHVHFTGTVIYKKTIQISQPDETIINLGNVQGISELFINGNSCGVKWYGRRIWNIGKYLKKGDNTIEVRITTTMGNYVKTLKDNKTTYRWMYRKNGTEQPLQSMGLIGPVNIYKL
jgi:hypothetical protein